MINHHDSWTHRLPPEILATVASHLEADTSLVTATHVCHFWRATLLSSPRLWSHLNFKNEERALVFLERSKSTPLVVGIVYADDPSEIVRESLNEVAIRVTALWAEHGPFLDELLAHPMPILEFLNVTEASKPPPTKPAHLPSLTSLVIYGLDTLQFHVPLLTSFYLTHDYINPSQRWTAGILLDFFRNCPLLETIFLSCDVLPDSNNEAVSLPFLRSITHKSPSDEYQLHLFDRLSLSSTCRVSLVIDVTRHLSDPWIPGLPTPRDSSYISDIRTIKITADSRNPDDDERHIMFKIEFVNSTHKAISFDRVSYYSDRPSSFSYQDFSGILETVETGSVETLCFDRYPVDAGFTLPNVTPAHIAQGLWKFRNLKTLILAECNTTLFLDGASSCPPVDTLVVYCGHHIGSFYTDGPEVQEFAASRKKAGYPLKAVTLIYRYSKPHPSELEELTNCVGSVEVMSGDDALGWDMDEYLLGAATHGGKSNRF